MRNVPIQNVNAAMLMLVLLGYLLYHRKPFLEPLFYAILLVMLMLPVCNKLEAWGMSRLWASLSGVVIIVLFTGGLVAIVAAQLTGMAEDWPKMQATAERMISQLQSWIESQYGFSPSEQVSYLQKGADKASGSAGRMVGAFFSGLMGFVTGFVLTLLYFFFLIWKREKYREFFLKLVDTQNRRETAQELDEISKVAGQYLIGRLISMGFLALCYGIGFSIVGLENGVLIALVAVIPTLVPYVGSILGGLIVVAMAVLGGSQDMLIPIISILVVAQIIDNNIIEPLVEGESLGISPIWTIVAIVIGELLWGVAGMILFIPMFAIAKIVCDHIPALHPYAFLLNNELDEPKWMKKVKDWFKSK